MGDRGDVLRALILAGAALMLGGCLDFVEPELPERGAAAVARLTIVLSDSGTLALEGRVVPGLDEAGFRRAVTDADVVVGDIVVPPSDTTRDVLRYDEARPIQPGRLTDPGRIRGPMIDGTAGPPTVRWPGLGRVDADTVSVLEDGSLRLRVSVGTDGDVADVSQWFLTLTGDTAVFRLSANGPPPETIDVPARWVPADAPLVTARLIYQQSALLDAADDYVGIYLLDLRLHWTIRNERP